jgi:hypothetical protein
MCGSPTRDTAQPSGLASSEPQGDVEGRQRGVPHFFIRRYTAKVYTTRTNTQGEITTKETRVTLPRLSIQDVPL